MSSLVVTCPLKSLGLLVSTSSDDVLLVSVSWEIFGSVVGCGGGAVASAGLAASAVGVSDDAAIGTFATFATFASGVGVQENCSGLLEWVQ
jgi:hypothetical protein